jgi:branched-subunit amino acid aminotransferase/4-amino-4-deoxychorismate lyase
MNKKDRPRFKGANMLEKMNRAFLYGESIFSTMGMRKGKVAHWEDHFQRLQKGAQFLWGPFDEGPNWEMALQNSLQKILPDEDGDKLVRLTIYHEQARGPAPAVVDSVSELKVDIFSSPYDFSIWDKKKVRLRSCNISPRPFWWPSYLKAGSYLDAIVAQKLFLRPGDDDLLFLSPESSIWESSVANIFLVSKNKLYTAPLGPNVLDGVMRGRVIKKFSGHFLDLQEVPLTLKNAYDAEMVFGTNSIRGPFLIDRIDQREYSYSDEMLRMFEHFRKWIIDESVEY